MAKARKAKKAAKKGSSAGGSSAIDALADAAVGAGGSSAGGQGDEDDPRWTPKLKVLKAKAGHKNRANQKHASGVWELYSPTGVLLGEEFCKATFDHSDGKAWAIAVYNPKVHKAPKKPRDGEWYPSTKDRLRFYEKEPRTIVFVPRIAPARSDIVHIDPNERMFPTQHKFDPGRFLGTLCSAVDLVWFTEEDNASKSSYEDWAGSIEELSTPEFGVHKYFSDIVPGYYVKVDTSDTKKYAVLYVYRPFKSADGEPEIVVLEIDKDDKFVEGAPLRTIKGAQIIEVGGGNNSLCKSVVKWLKENMGHFFNGCQVASGTEDGQVDPAHVVEHLLGILDRDIIMKNYQEMSRKLADMFEMSDIREPFMGVRKGRMEWIEITKESTDPKVPHETETQQTGVYKEVTDYDKWYNRNLLRAVEILQFTTEFASKHNSGQEDISVAADLSKLLTLHEEDILKDILKVNWQNTKQSHVYRFFDDPYHKLDADDHIMEPVHVPYMMSYFFLSIASDTTATVKGDDRALHTENTVWTSKRARVVLHSRIKNQIERNEKPQWLNEEIVRRDKCLTDEAKKARKAQNRKSSGAEKAGEPLSDDDELGKAKPKKKAAKDQPWDPMNRKVLEDTPRGHVDKFGTDFDGCKDEDRKVGVVACFLNSAGTRKNKHLWCVCDRAKQGHWVSTQGMPQVHPNALKNGYAISSTHKKFWKDGKPAPAQGKCKAAASSSSTGSTLAEADLRIAKDNIEDLHKQITDLVSVRDELHLQLHKSMDLGNEQLSTAARTANETAHAHAKQLRTTKEITSNAIAKMKAMRQHAHGFAELMLPHAVHENAPDHIACWAAFSGLLDDAAINEALGKQKSKSASSAAVYNIDEFNTSTGSVTMNSPAPNVAFNLTVAKVKAFAPPRRLRATRSRRSDQGHVQGQGQGGRGSRRSASATTATNDEDEDDRRHGSSTDDDQRLLGTGLRSPFRTSGGRSSPPPRFPDPLPAAAPVRARTERAERTSTSGCARTALYSAVRTKYSMCKMTFSIFQAP